MFVATGGASCTGTLHLKLNLATPDPIRGHDTRGHELLTPGGNPE